MSTDSDLQDSIERTKQAFRSAPDSPPLVVRRDEASWPAPKETAGLHPFIRGLIEALPEPRDEWPQPEREKWLETARHIFGLLYADGQPRAASPSSPPIPGAPLVSDAFERRTA